MLSNVMLEELGILGPSTSGHHPTHNPPITMPMSSSSYSSPSLGGSFPHPPHPGQGASSSVSSPSISSSSQPYYTNNMNMRLNKVHGNSNNATSSSGSIPSATSGTMLDLKMNSSSSSLSPTTPVSLQHESFLTVGVWDKTTNLSSNELLDMFGSSLRDTPHTTHHPPHPHSHPPPHHHLHPQFHHHHYNPQVPHYTQILEGFSPDPYSHHHHSLKLQGTSAPPTTNPSFGDGGGGYGDSSSSFMPDAFGGMLHPHVHPHHPHECPNHPSACPFCSFSVSSSTSTPQSSSSSSSSSSTSSSSTNNTSTSNGLSPSSSSLLPAEYNSQMNPWPDDLNCDPNDYLISSSGGSLSKGGMDMDLSPTTSDSLTDIDSELDCSKSSGGSISLGGELCHISPPKRKVGRPPKKDKKMKRNEKKTGRLWEFIRDLLKNPEYCPSLVRWENPEEGHFRFVNSEKVAQLWGQIKGNPRMTYEKLSRAMRYYYKSHVFEPVLGRRLVYKFGYNATNWKPVNPNFVTMQKLYS